MVLWTILRDRPRTNQVYIKKSKIDPLCFNFQKAGPSELSTQRHCLKLIVTTLLQERLLKASLNFGSFRCTSYEGKLEMKDCFFFSCNSSRIFITPENKPIDLPLIAEVELIVQNLKESNIFSFPPGKVIFRSCQILSLTKFQNTSYQLGNIPYF